MASPWLRLNEEHNSQEANSQASRLIKGMALVLLS